MALAGELAKYIGGELVKNTGKELATNAATSALSNLAPKIATKAGAKMATGSVLSSLVPSTARKLASGVELGSEAIPLFRGQTNRLDKLDYNKGLSPNSNGFFMTPNKSATDSWAGKGVVSVDADPNDIMTLSELNSLKKDAEKYMSDPKLQMQLYNENPDLAEIYDALYASDNYQELSRLTKKPFIERDGGQGTELGEVVFFPDTNPELTSRYNTDLASGKNQWITPAEDETVSGTSLPVGTKIRFNKDLSIKSIDKPSRGRGWFADNSDNPHIAQAIKQSGADKYLGKPKINYSLAEEPDITLYHGTPNKFEDFDDSLPSVWFSDSDKNLRDTGLSIKGGQPMNIMERQLPKDLKIADEDLADRLTKQQLQDRGYAGIAYTERGPNGDETYYEIFNPNKTLRKIPEVQQSKVELSPQQQEFFKDSVVRDENGELIPMYHGTRGDFTIFGDKSPSSSSNSHSSVGYWFTPNEEGAKNFASSIWYGDGEPKAMKTYLNIKNPKVYESVDNSKAVDLLREKLSELEMKSKISSKPKLYYKNMYDYTVAQNMVNQGNKDMAIKWLADKNSYDDKTATELIEEIDNLKKLADEKKKLQDEIAELKYGDAYERFRTDIYKVDGQTAEDANVGGIGMALKDAKSVQKYVDNLKAQGYDGIIIKGTNYDADTMGGINDQYVAFYPEQIKNVDNLNPTNNPDIRYATGLGKGSGGFDESIERIGSEGIPATRKETLPDGWDILEKYLGGVDKRVENAIGKAKSKITKKDLVQFLDENDYDSEGTFSELWQRVKDAVDYMTTEELNYAGGGSAADIIQMRQRPDMNNIEDVYMGNKGHTGRLDAEYSDRLGISKSTTPMSDKLSQPLEYAQGDYGAGVIGLDTTWSSGEAGVSNVAHERFHAWQEKSRGFDYSEEFKKAFEELEDEIIPLLHNKDEISKYWNGRNTDYYFDRNEQEARMVQDYLEYKNHTKRYMGGKRKYEYDERIIEPFDKFFEKLRKLSKKGIALPAIAGLFGIGALANKKDDKKA